MKNHLLTTLLLLIFGFNSLSTHFSGGNIYYDCLGNNQYKIWAEITTDCFVFSGVPTFVLQTSNSCGISLPNLVLTHDANLTQEISQLCPPQLPYSFCNNIANLPGRTKHVYSGIVTLLPCNSWTISVYSNARNGAIINLINPQSSMFLQTTLNSVTDSCNNSVRYLGSPNPYVRINSIANYNFGGFDPDGDKLKYELVSAKSSDTSFYNYTSPYSAQNPINGMIIDSLTGQIVFVPNTIGAFVVVVKVSEYDLAGNLKGTTIRDIQIVVLNFSNNYPSVDSSSLYNLVGAGIITGPNSILVCPGDSFNIDFKVYDVDINDTVSLSQAHTISTQLPGAQITYTRGNPLIGTLSWRVPTNARPSYSLYVEAIDDNCPIFGVNSFNLKINTQKDTTLLKNQTICFGDSAILLFSLGNNVTWSSISGPSIAVGTNFSCDTCGLAYAYPAASSSYKAEYISNSGCIVTDTFNITVSPTFNYNFSQSSPVFCYNKTTQVSIQPVQADSYTYQWFPSPFFSSDTISNPFLNPINTAISSYQVLVTNSTGCKKLHTFSANIFTPQSNITSDTVCDFYTSISGQIYYTNAIIFDTVFNAFGCDSLINTLHLTVDSSDLTTNLLNQKFLSVINSPGRTYQWINCNTGLIIPGATTANYTANTAGSFACVITNLNCVDTSICRNINYVGIDEQNNIPEIKLYPNPSSDKTTLIFDKNIYNSRIEIKDINGKLVRIMAVDGINKIEIDLEEIEKGVYFIHLLPYAGYHSARLIKM